MNKTLHWAQNFDSPSDENQSDWFLFFYFWCEQVIGVPIRRGALLFDS